MNTNTTTLRRTTRPVRDAADLALALLVGAVARGGATVTPTLQGPDVPTTGYAVGGAVPGYATDLATLDRHALEHAVASLAREAAARGAWLGSWSHAGRLWIDVAEYLGDLSDAVDLACTRGELAVWDVARGEEVDVRVVATRE